MSVVHVCIMYLSIYLRMFYMIHLSKYNDLSKYYPIQIILSL